MAQKIKEDIKKHKIEKENTELVSGSLADIKERFKITEANKKQVIETADAIFEKYKEEYEESIKEVDPRVTPIGMSVIVTCKLMSLDEQADFLMQNAFKPEALNTLRATPNSIQKVMAVGKSCQDVKVGDTVEINMSDFYRIKNPNSVKAEEVDEIPYTKIRDRIYMKIHERNIAYIIND